MSGSPRPARGNVSASCFRPAPGLANPHLQTVAPTLFLCTPSLALKHETFELPDGDFLELVWSGLPPNGRPPAKLLIVLHGLEGSWRSPYVRSLLWRATAAGWSCVVMQFRGCGERPNRLDRTYHSGDTDDLAVLIDYLQDRLKPGVLAAAGYSLGGNALLKYLGEGRDKTPLAAATAVSVPMVLSESAWQLEQGLSRFYQWWFLRTLKRKLSARFGSRGDAPIDLARMLNARTMAQFDDAATAPLHGFRDAAHYYAQSSSRQFLKAITVPTLVLQARDDPFMTDGVLPSLEELSATVTLELSPNGGHVGFVAGPAGGGFHWLANRLVSFFEQTTGSL